MSSYVDEDAVKEEWADRIQYIGDPEYHDLMQNIEHEVQDALNDAGVVHQ